MRRRSRPGQVLRILLVALVVAVLVLPGCATAAKPERVPVRPSRPDKPKRYLRFKSTYQPARSGHPVANWQAEGWIDFEGTLLSVSQVSGWGGSTKTVVSGRVMRTSTQEPRNRGYVQYEERDAPTLPAPYDLIRSYEEKVRSLSSSETATRMVAGTETVGVTAVMTGETTRVKVDVRTSDYLPVRITIRGREDASEVSRYVLEVEEVPASEVPANAFLLVFPETVEPYVERRLNPAEAAAFDRYEVYWLGDEYEGLPRVGPFYRMSGMQGSFHASWPEPKETPLWAYSRFGKESVATGYWTGGDGRSFETTKTRVGWSTSSRSPDIEVRSMSASDVAQWATAAKKWQPKIAARLLKALESNQAEVVAKLRVSPYAQPKIMAKRFGDTVVFVTSNDAALVGRAIEEVRPTSQTKRRSPVPSGAP